MSTFTTKWDQLPTSEKIDLMKDYYEFIEDNYSSFDDFVRYTEDNGTDMTGVTISEFHRIWDLMIEG